MNKFVQSPLPRLSLVFILAVFIFIISIKYIPTEDYFEGDGFSGRIVKINYSLFYTNVDASDIGNFEQYGFLTHSGNRIIFHQVYKEKESIVKRDTLILVKWGARKYLISPSEMDLFCEAINSKREPRRQAHGGFLLAEGDWKKETNGMPDLPNQYLKTIRDVKKNSVIQ